MSLMTRGLQATIDDTAIESGKFRFAVDTGKLFIDTQNDRIEITDMILGLKYNEVIALQSPLPKIYLTTDTHQLLAYNPYTETWNAYGGGEYANSCTSDDDGNVIVETYIKSIRYADDGSGIYLIFGNDEEKFIEDRNHSAQQIANLQEQVADLQETVEYQRTLIDAIGLNIVALQQGQSTQGGTITQIISALDAPEVTSEDDEDDD